MRPRNLCLALSLILFMIAAAQAATLQPLIDVNVDRPDGVYKTGEYAVFTVKAQRALPEGGIKFRYTIIRDGITTESTGRMTLKSSPIEFKRTILHPGQMMCRVRWESATSTGTSAAGAVFSPYKIQPSLDEPADFDEFWARQKATLAGDYKAEVVPLASKQPGIDLYHVKIPMPDGPPLQGYMTKPHGAAPRSLGAIAFTHGAYVPTRSSNIPARPMGMIAFDFNPHGSDDGMPPSFYAKLTARGGPLNQFWNKGWESRDTVYFLRMYKRALRALDFLTRQPEWDGKTLAIFGGSMGGAQAIAMAALDQRVSVIVAGVPAMCDLTGFAVDRVDGWPHVVKTDRCGKPLNQRYVTTARYFDGDNFAKRIHCDVFMAIGLIDTTCPPVSILAAYNQLGSDRKQMLIMPKKAHEFSTDMAQRAIGEKFIQDHIQRVRQ